MSDDDKALDTGALEELVKEGDEIEAKESAEAAEAAFDSGFTGEEIKEEPKEDPEEAEDNREDEPPKEEDPPKIEPKPEPKAEPRQDDQLATRLRKVEGTLGELTSRIRTMQRAGNKAAADQGGKSPTKEQVEEAMGSTDKWKALSKDFPEWTEAAEAEWSLQEKRIKNLIPDTSGYLSKSDFEEALKEERQKIKDEMREEREREKVDNKYPEWETIVHTPELKSWLQVQDEETILLYSSDKGSDIIKMLDKFESWKKGVVEAEEKTSRLNKAIPPTTRSSIPKTKVESVEDAFESGFAGT